MKTIKVSKSNFERLKLLRDQHEFVHYNSLIDLFLATKQIEQQNKAPTEMAADVFEFKKHIESIIKKHYSEVEDIIEDDVKNLDPEIKKMFSIGSKFALKMIAGVIK